MIALYLSWRRLDYARKGLVCIGFEDHLINASPGRLCSLALLGAVYTLPLLSYVNPYQVHHYVNLKPLMDFSIPS